MGRMRAGCGWISWLLLPALTCLLALSAAAPVSSGFSGRNALGLPDSYPSVSSHPRWESRVVMRSLMQANGGRIGADGKLILAADRTDRRDVLDRFKIYRGGWDIRNKHYWSSAGWTGLPGFVIAAAWLIVGIVSLVSFWCCLCCCRRGVKNFEYKSGVLGYVFLIILLTVFTAAAVLGAVWLYIGEERLNHETSGTLDYVVNQSQLTQERLRSVSAFLLDIQRLQVLNQSIVPAAGQQQLRSLSASLNNSAASLQNKTDDNAHKIRNGLKWVRIALIIVAGVMLVLVILGLVFSLVGISSVSYTLGMVGWILVVATWVSVGVFLLLHSVMGDTCEAMKEWVANPAAHTSLDDILPCVDPAQADQTLQQITTYSTAVVNILDRALNKTNSPQAVGYNASGPLVPLLNLTGPVNLTSASSIWSGYVCQTGPNGTCVTTGRITPELYRDLASGVTIARNLTVYGPFLIDLENCNFVRETFSVITETRCHKLQKYTGWIYWGLIMVSGGAMLAILLWILSSRRQNRRVGRRGAPNKPPMYGGTTATARPPSVPSGSRVVAPDGAYMA